MVLGWAESGSASCCLPARYCPIRLYALHSAICNSYGRNRPPAVEAAFNGYTYFLIFAEIFTTLIADVYGLTLQLQERLKMSRTLLTICVLAACYLASQIGFGKLLATLYPLFGLFSLGWLILLVWQRPAAEKAIRMA